MCGPSRPSTGNLIAIIFPSLSGSSSSSSSSSYSLTFSHDPRTPDGPTRAIFRFPDPKVREIFSAARGVDLRIEKYGDLTASVAGGGCEPPLYWFRVGLDGGSLSPLSLRERERERERELELEQGGQQQIEVVLPERLELGVSGTGIVGREVRVAVEGVDALVEMGRGVVGFD
ncbi:hypothetical protein BO86DRAFT_410483 [Aspergillus japonicus CBS 114.51]|uniref:Uncharacterized protein n=1 Tax=Aspergillus japonicus CBS 114.51 TaxID=1448312 RepID=A0A8T8WZ40_ASPJA|nr:hypothetical protein BO86DRAFT_410483 [Aspergillus japonicus CBS 114.51]RAH80934.1 hypothetical protein BO86DRAFT_410483 [Aspergillus japonicus CBS 114.51]